MSLSQFIVIKSNANGKYLQYSKKTGSTPSSLNFSHQMKRQNLDLEAEKLESLKNDATLSKEWLPEFHLMKFKVEEAKDAPGFVHISTCYNNKYLVRKSEESKSIAAEAHEAEEDQTKWSCTLFKPVFLGEAEEDEEDEGCRLFGNKHGIGMTPQNIQLVHAASQDYVTVDTETGSMELTSTAPTAVTVSDVVPTAVIPKYFALRDKEKKYLGTHNGADLYFRYTDIADPAVPSVTLRGSTVPPIVNIYSQNFQGYWALNPWSDLCVSTRSPFAIFAPIRVGNQIALYVTNNNRFVTRTPNGGVTVTNPTIIEDARMEVAEPVLSRTILSVTYDLQNARVYGTSRGTKVTDSRENYTNQNLTGSLSKDYSTSQTMSWNQSLTVSVGMSMGMSFGIPKVGVGAEVSIDYSVSETVEWGEEKTETETITHVFDFDVPPKTRQVKTVMATRSTCDVPFTCRVLDLMTNGVKREYTKTDCWFTGANDYNVKQETHNFPLTG